MPELAELKLTADYINKTTKGQTFQHIEKNPVHKGDDIKAPYSFKLWAQSKGKELVLYLLEVNGDQHVPIRMTMGMSGHFKFTKSGEEVKHSHLMFKNDKYTLSFVDVRRFGKWKYGHEWSKNRGPDPTLDLDAFIANVMENLDKKAFDKPIHEVLMNQKYFNGIGNYLRAEILYRLPHINPFKPARTVLQQEPQIFMLCKAIPELAYVLGGGKLKSWENPLGESAAQPGKSKLFKCYNQPNMSKVKDRSGRTFWYDPVWDQLDMETEWDYYSGLPNPKVYEETI